MAKIRIILDKRRKLADESFPIKYSIYINNKGKLLISSGISINEVNFYEGKIIGIPRKDILNNVLKFKFNKIDDTLLKLEMSGDLHSLSLNQIKSHINEVLEIGPEQNKPSTFFEHYETFISYKNKKTTIDIYKDTITKIGKYNNLKTLTFEEMNLSWLRDFEFKLKTEGLKINTISIYFRNIRTIFNNAIEEDIISQNLYPFRKFKIKTEATQKRSLTAEQLKLLRDYPCEEHQAKYRDIFMLIFYFIGINAIDLLEAPKLPSDNMDRLDYRRSKTGRLYSIKIENEAREIIDKYQGEKYLLDVMDNHSNHKDFLKRLNQNLKLIGTVDVAKHGKKTRSPIFPELSTYWARHTWATIANDLEIPKETISAALGHGGNSVTDIYINFNTKKIDEANRKIIDYLNNL